MRTLLLCLTALLCGAICWFAVSDTSTLVLTYALFLFAIIYDHWVVQKRQKESKEVKK